MIRIIWLFFFALAGVARAEGPAEPPPPDFAGAQYIDSTGCVFQREGTGWVARIGPDDAPVCGWPPSLGARRTDPETETVLAPARPEKEPGVEEKLMTALAEGLRDGELVADRMEPEARLPVEEPKPTEGPMAELDALMAAAPALRSEMAGGVRPNERLCDLLGYQGEASRLPALGNDPTGGFCGGLAPVALVTRVASGTAPAAAQIAPAAAAHAAEAGADHALAAADAHAAPVGADHAVADAPAAGHEPSQHAPADAGTRPLARPAASADKLAAATAPQPETASKPAAKPVEAASPRRTARVERAARPSDEVRLEMIPASARYVMIGRFDSPAAAATVMDRVAAMGYPVARGQAQGVAGARTAVLAGPFGDRRQIVAALNALRRKGYTGAVAR